MIDHDICKRPSSRLVGIGSAWCLHCHKICNVSWAGGGVKKMSSSAEHSTDMALTSVKCNVGSWQKPRYNLLNAYGNMYWSKAQAWLHAYIYTHLHVDKPSQAMLPTPPVKSPCISKRLLSAYGTLFLKNAVPYVWNFAKNVFEKCRCRFLRKRSQFPEHVCPKIPDASRKSEHSVYIYICTCTTLYVHRYTCMYMYIYTLMHINMCVQMYASIHIWARYL